MRPRIEGSIGDEGMEDCGFLKFTDDSLKGSFLQTMSTMRKHRLFCDIILNVGNTDIHAHRNVLACVSPYLMERFSAEQENVKKSTDGTIPSYRLNGYITKYALQILVDYAYTAVLEIPDTLVKDVYLAAWQLRMETVVTECARHLTAELCVETCIDNRSLPGINRNKNFVNAVDAFVAKEFEAVSKTPEFFQLTGIQIDVLYQTKQEMGLVTHSGLCRLVLDWIKRTINENTLTMQQLIERSHLLYLALDNSLQDCSELPTGHDVDSDIVQDYKRIAMKCPTNKSRKKFLAAPVRPRVIIYSRDIGERQNEECQESDWDLIGSTMVADHTFVSLVTLNGSLTRLSIQLRLNIPTTPSPVNTPEILSIIDEIQKPELFCEIGTMSGPKCGLGVGELNGKMIVCGGYDRGECLKLVETYCPDKNIWTLEPSMIEARGRVQMAIVNETIYIVGGSNGTTELDTVECLPKSALKWKKCCKLPLARSNAGVCQLNNKVYCIGGWNGQIGIKQCDVYTPEDDKWTSIAPLQKSRHQMGVCTFMGKLWAVGGSDSWTCLGVAEIYDPTSDQWNFTSNLLTSRRGCGLAEFKGKLYCVGGSDGTHSLSSTEIYDEDTKSWVLGPNLTTPRANVAVIVVQGKLYAIGGFSGKTFLNTIEYLDPLTNEWTTFVSQQNSEIEKITEVLAKQNCFRPIKIANGHENGSCEILKKKNGDCILKNGGSDDVDGDAVKSSIKSKNDKTNGVHKKNGIDNHNGHQNGEDLISKDS